MSLLAEKLLPELNFSEQTGKYQGCFPLACNGSYFILYNLSLFLISSRCWMPEASFIYLKSLCVTSCLNLRVSGNKNQRARLPTDVFATWVPLLWKKSCCRSVRVSTTRGHVDTYFRIYSLSPSPSGNLYGCAHTSNILW